MSEFEEARRIIKTEAALQELEESINELEKSIKDLGGNYE